MSLLTIVQDAASQLGLAQPSSVIGSSILTSQILLRFANQEGRELAAGAHDWQNLITDYTLTAVATAPQGAFPAGFARLIYNAEIFNRTTNQKFFGPTAQRFWKQLQANSTSGTAGYWRIINNQLNIWPAPTAGNSIDYEYITNKWCLDADGVTTKERFALDTDTVNIANEELFTLGLVWRFRHSRGFAQYAEDMASYERQKEILQSRDRGTGRIRTLSGPSNWPLAPVFSGVNIG